MAVQNFTAEELEQEEWRDVVGFEGFYSVSNLGRIRRERAGNNTYAGKILRSRYVNGYLFIKLSKNGQTHNDRVHRLVSAAFLGPCPEGLEVNHIDSDPGNARIENLEYVTHLQNMQHAVRQGRLSSPRAPRGPLPKMQGENSGVAKLTNANVIAIRLAILHGVSGTEIARRYGVCSMAVSLIKRGKRWAHLEQLRDEVIALGSPK